ncbi:MAG: hypothetical protein ACTSUG_13940 [Candidatus Helarchaeota archaeon]
MIKKKVNKITSFFIRNKRLSLALLIFIVVFCFLGLPFKNWWFAGGQDDYTHIYNLGYKTKNWSWQKISTHFFNDGNHPQEINSTSYKKQSFLTTCYRPFACILNTLFYRLFNTNTYCFHLANVFIHAINAIILFFIFLYFTSFLIAFLLSLLWAFHPILGYNFSNFVQFHGYIDLTWILLVFIFLKKYLDSKKWLFYLLSCLFFTISLFTRETSIVLPSILFLGVYLYKNRLNTITIKSFLKQFITNLKTVSGFISISICFLSLRLYLYPIGKISFTNSSTIASNITFIQTIKNLSTNIFIYSKLFIYDLFGLSLIPWEPSYKILRLGLFITILFSLIFLFIKNRKKIYIIYFLISGLILFFPAFVRQRYTTFHLYNVYPFIFLIFIFLFKFYKGKKQFKFKKTLITTLIVLTLSSIFLTTKMFYRREKIMALQAKAIQNLIQNYLDSNKTICLIGLPAGLFENKIETLLYTLTQNENLKIFYDLSFVTRSTNIFVNKIPEWKILLNKYYKEKFLKENLIEIKTIKNGFKFITKNPKKIFFKFNNNNYPSCGKKIINKTTKIKNEKLVTNFTLIIDSKILKKNLTFITWDYKKSKLIILKNKGKQNE